MKNIANDLAIFLHIQGLQIQESHCEKFGRNKIKGHWGSFVTEGIRVSLPVDRRVGFWRQNLGNKFWVSRLDWRESLVGQERQCYMTIFIYPKARENPITPKKDGSQIPRRKKNKERKPGCHIPTPLKKISSSRFPGLPPGEGDLPLCDLEPSAILSSFVY